MRLVMAALLALGIVAASVWVWATAAIDPAYSGNEAANADFASGDFGAALERYRALQRDRPGLAQLRVNAGNTLYRLADYARGLADHDVAITTTDLGVRAVAFYDRGNTLFRLGRYEDARESYRDSLRLEPANRDAKVNLELVDRLLRPIIPTDQPGQQGGPGPNLPAPPQQGGQQGQQPQPGQQAPPGQQAQGSQQQGSAPDSSNTGAPAPSLNRAVEEFRRNLTSDEALRLLDALRAQQRGVDTLIEGRPTTRPGQEPLY
jgi:Ca-activated chloride channel family protein